MFRPTKVLGWTMYSNVVSIIWFTSSHLISFVPKGWDHQENNIDVLSQ